MTKPKRHHFVPKAYLENFKNPVDGFLYVYDKISESYRKQRPSQVFVRNKYYQQSWVPAGIDENIFEKKLGSEFEPKGLNSLQKMIDQPTTLTDDDTENIINFIQLQRLRVPRQAEIAKGLAKAAVEMELLKTPKGRDTLKLGKVIIKDPIRFEFIKNTLGSLSPYLSRMQWEVVTAQRGSSFITSDSPVSFLNKRFVPPNEPGIALIGTEVIFPLSISKLLVMRHPEFANDVKINPLASLGTIDIEDGYVEIITGDIWEAERIRATNWLILQLSQRVIVGDNKETLDTAKGVKTYL